MSPSVDAIRARFVEDLRSMLLRPDMFGHNQGYAALVMTRLDDLALLDSHENELRSLVEELRSSHQENQCGVSGAFRHYHMAEVEDFTDETASVYAQVSARLGYFEPFRRLSVAEWNELSRGAVSWATGSTRTVASLAERFGPPSYAGSGQAPCVHAYAGMEDRLGWWFFDFAFVEADWQGHSPEDGFGRYYLRNVRVPGEDFKKAVRFTDVGMRWKMTWEEFCARNPSK